MFESPLQQSIIKRAQEKGHIQVQLQNIRDFGKGKYKSVDDAPFGGGAGMVMRPDVLALALRAAKERLPEGKIVFLSPQGERLSQKKCAQLAGDQTPLILLCGHFEGIDERVKEMFVDEEISLGDFVLTGGEIPAMALIDSVTRLLPGVLGNAASHQQESFSQDFAGRLEYPHYTRPEVFEGKHVPAVLLSGNHAQIEQWRQKHLAGFSTEEFEVFQFRKQYFSAQKPWKGKRILLRNHLPEDVENWLVWLNDEEVTEYLSFDPPYTRQDEEEYFAYTQENLQGFFLTILERSTNVPLGNVSLELFEHNPQNAELGIFLGNKDMWGQGYGKETVRAIQKIGFEVLGLEKIFLKVLPKNTKAIHVYEDCGFLLSGVSRNEVRKNNQTHTVFLMEILKKEWEEKKEQERVKKQFLEYRYRFSVEE